MDYLQTASSFLILVWDFIVKFFSFLIDTASKTIEFFNFLFSMVFEIPYIILSVFDNLPNFMQVGLSIVFHGVVFVLVLKIIKIIRDVFI